MGPRHRRIRGRVRDCLPEVERPCLDERPHGDSPAPHEPERSLPACNDSGPRQLIRHNRQGFIGWFIRLAIEDAEIPIYGDGSQLRDFVYVDDAADAFLRAGASDACNGEVFNIAGETPVSHRDLTALLIEIAGRGRVRFVEWPPEKKAIDIGNFYATSAKFSGVTGWRTEVTLPDGLGRAIDYYEQHWPRYVEPAL